MLAVVERAPVPRAAKLQQQRRQHGLVPESFPRVLDELVQPVLKPTLLQLHCSVESASWIQATLDMSTCAAISPQLQHRYALSG